MSWLNSWKKRVKLTIDNTNVDGTLSDFPVLIKLSDSSGITSTDVTSVFTELGSDSNRKKIAVTTSDGTTQCYVEIERFDYSNSVAWLWAKVLSVSNSAETILYLYYDSAQPDNTTYVGDTGDVVAQNVWDSNFKLVMHMAQDPNGDVADAIKDSTSNANHGTPAGAMTTADLVDGKIGKGIDFDGDNDNVNCGSGTNLDDISVKTIELCIKLDAQTGTNSWSHALNKTNWFLSTDPNNSRNMFGNNFSVSNGRWSFPQFSLATLHYLVVSYDNQSVANDPTILLNNISQEITEYATPEGTVTSETSDDLYFGNQLAINRGIDGIIDEVRISNTARSAVWLKATYYSNWDELISFGSEQVGYISGYVKEGTIPINRQIYLHNRDTGALITSTTSSGAGGYFYLETTYSGAHYVVCLDDEAGVDYNDLIYGNIYPVTTSG